MSAARRERLSRVLLAAALLLAALAVLVPVFPDGAEAADTGTAADGSVRRTVHATRTSIAADGTETVVDERDVTLEVSQTADLRGRQEVRVSWSGAHPTGGVVPDPGSSDGRTQEYPLVLLQCRGVDTAGAVPAGQDRLTPETCWTQTSPERYIAAASSTPAWRFDAEATAADRGPVVGAPDPLPAACAALSEPVTARWLPFRAQDGTVYHGGPDPSVGCAPLAPESDSAEGGGLPSNTTYGVTRPDGTGATDFAVWTEAENASLGCSAQVSCALVAVPVMGLSCDPWGTRLGGVAQTTRTGAALTPTQLASAADTCTRTGAYAPGENRSGTSTDQAVRGNLWWSASNWRHRITVPLRFATTGEVCDGVSDQAPQEMLGSVVANELTASWRPTFCTTPGLSPFAHVQQSDALARRLVQSGEVDAALTSEGPQGRWSRPVVQAPLTLGGFAIAFSVDDAEHQRRTELKLNARLVAKLLTTSYPALAVVRDHHPDIGGNPLNITLDPEFQALNPGLPRSSTLEAAAALETFSAGSDLMRALSSWLDADAEARAFLNGNPDPWGMTVNEAYRGIDLPVDSWPLLDSWIAPEFYQTQNACYGRAPTAFMQLVANPVSSLGAVLVNMQYASSTVQTACRFDGTDVSTLPLKQLGRQVVGYRFVLGLVSTSAAERYNLRTAALQTTSTVRPTTRFTDGEGRTFVRADPASLAAAAGLLEPDHRTDTWRIDYARTGSPDAARAYPGALPIYLDVPTEGLDAAAATRLARFLCYAAGPGQQPGRANGRLPAGYVPLTDDNGLGAQRAYLTAATAAVRRQEGEVPDLDAPAPDAAATCDFATEAPAPVDTPEPTATPDPTAPPAAATPPVAAAPPAAVGAVPTAAVPVAAAPPGKASPPATAAPAELDAVLAVGETSDLGRLGVPLLLLLAVLAGLAGAVLRFWEALAAAGAAVAPHVRSVVQRGPGGGAHR